MVNVNIILRAAQTALILPNVAMNGYVTYWYKTHTVASTAPSATIVPTALGGISLLALLYLFFNGPLQISQGHRTTNPRLFNKWAVLALDSVLAAAWFIVGAQEAAFRAGLHLCFGQNCKCMTAAAALGFVTGVTFIVTTALAAIHVLRTRGGDAAPPAPRTAHDEWVGVAIDGEKKEQETSA